jgi:2-polyprenyl-3-methyl-5-hydroxy-6-metoxy-1,4-benzoquinol methylase
MADENKLFNPQQYWEKRLQKQWTLNGVGYIGMGRFNDWVYRAKGSVFDRIVRSLPLPTAFTILDIGCGTGFYIDRWKTRKAGKITGMDLTDVAVQQLRAKYPDCEFLQGDIGDSSKPPQEEVDVVSAMDVLFHIVDDKRYAQALRNIYSLVKPGGYFVFTEFFLHHEPLVAQHHVSRTLASIGKMAEDAGFSIVKRAPTHILMNQPLDTTNRFVTRAWDEFTSAVERRPGLGSVAGAVLFPIDMLLVRMLRESPSTEIMVCQKP